MLGMKAGEPESSRRLEQRGKTQILRKTASVVYYVISDTLNDSDDLILATPGIPTLFSFANGAYVSGYDLKQTHQVTHYLTGALVDLWEVTVHLDSHIDTTQTEQNPLAQRPSIEWDGETEEEVLERDIITGQPIVTAANEPILITTPVVLPVLVIERYEPAPFDPDIQLAFANHVNSVTFYGAPPGTALMLPIRSREEAIEGITYSRTTYRIMFKILPGISEPWKAKPLHHGYYFRPTAGADPEIARDKKGNPITVNLNSNGTKKGANDAAEFLSFNRFPSVNHNLLLLGPF